VLANLRALLSVSLQLGGGRYATPYAFVRALKAGGVLAPAAVNPWRAPAHHSRCKAWRRRRAAAGHRHAERNAETWCAGGLAGEAAWPNKFVFSPARASTACVVPTLDAERMERQREELNALYVADAARHTLAISSIEPYRARSAVGGSVSPIWRPSHAVGSCRERAAPPRLTSMCFI